MTRKAQPTPENNTATAQESGLGTWLNQHRTTARLVLAVLVPTLLLATTEGLLRIAGYGYPTSLFLPVAEVESYGSNRHFGWRFFPREIARTPVPQSFPVTKADPTCRIFTLGASAALGVPNSAFSFSRSLEVMLHTRYPGVRFEFVNTAMTAINSHVVLPIANECADYEPDIYLVYLGNNEIIGPYGIGASHGGAAGNLTAVRAGIALRSTRLGQLGQSLVTRSRSGNFESEQWRGMQMYSRHKVRSDSPELTTVHDNFQRNLQDICRAGTNAGAKVVLSTVAVNLRDSPPFATMADSTAPTAVLDRRLQLIQTAQRLLTAGDPGTARDSLLVARNLEPPGCADTHYLLGQSGLALGNLEAARQGFAAALEFDGLRFRTDRRLNEIIRSTAAGLQEDGVLLADTEQILLASEPSGTGLPGHELFYEHVHLTFEGNYQIARALLPTIEKALPAWVRERAAIESPLPSINDCAQQLMFTAANEYLALAQMRTTITPYPFTAQLWHDDMLKRIDNDLAQLRAAATPEVQRATVEAYQRAYQRNPGDLQLAFNFARILSLTGNDEASATVMRKVMATQPPATGLDKANLDELLGGG